MIYQCAVIGNPIHHSQSPEIHAKFSKQYQLNVNYQKILANEDDFQQIVDDFFHGLGRGLNITIPFKEKAFAMADVTTPYAQCAKSANTLWMVGDKLYADNTDGRGLVLALQEQGIALSGQDILIIGAGGAARGIVLPLIEQGIKSLDILNRSPAKAQAIIDDHTNTIIPMHAYGLDALPPKKYDILINATSSGLSNITLPLEASLIKDPQTCTCYEMVYGHKTPFMQWAASCDVQYVFDGYSMLIAQARLSFNIWFAKEIAKHA